MGTKGSQTTTTTQAPQPQFAAQYNQLANRAVNLSQQPYQPYTGQLTAPINAQQYGAIDNINALYPQVSGMISGAAQPLTAAQIQQYYNPYQQNVINATEAQFANTNAQQQQQVLGNAVAQGALGGNRTGVAQAALAGQQQVAEAPVIAGLEQQGYTQAYGAAGQQFQQNPLAAAGLLSSTGTNIANTQFGMGTAEQQTQQNALNAQYQQYLAAMGYPYQNLAFATGEVGGLGSLAGGTGTVTAPPPSLLAQFGGLGIAGLGAYSAYQNAQARGGRVSRRQGGLVPHFASGGGPGNMPYAGGPTYIPTEPLPHGAGPPHPVSSPVPTNDIAKQASQIAGMFRHSGSNDAAADADASSFGPSIIGPSFGGGPYAGIPARDGGLILPQRNRIELKRGGPIRAGLGFSSFVPRRGYQYGGSPEELAAEGVPATFDERFPTQPGLAPVDFDDRFQGQAPPPDLDGGTIMQPGLEPPAVVSPPAPSVPQATPVQTAGVGQEEVPDIVTKGPEATTWQAKARRAAEAEGVDPNIFAGLIHQESGFNPNVRPSSAGAIGIAQFMPKTAAAEGVDPRNPDQSLQGSAHLMRKLLDKYGSYPLALAAYNAGEGRVDQHLSRGTPLPGETQRYVPAVMAFAGQGAQDAGETAGLGTDEGGYIPPPPRGRTSGLTTGQERPSGGKGPFGMNADVSMALMAAGLGMAAAGSRPGATFAGSVGQGGLAGLGAYGAEQRQHLAEQRVADEQRRLDEQEKHARASEKELHEYHQTMAGHQAEQTAIARQHKEYEESKLVPYNDPISGMTRMTQRDKNGIWRFEDGTPVMSGPNTPTDVPPSDDPARPFKNAPPSVGTIQKAQQMGLHGQAMLDAYPPMARNKLEAVAFYDAPITDFTKMGRAGMSQDNALAAVRQINPAWSQNWYGVQGQAFKNFFNGTSPQSPNVLSRAYNTAIGHAGELAEDIKLLHTSNPGIFQEARNAGVPFLSYLAANWQRRAAQGTPEGEAWTRIGAVLPLYGAETEKFYAGSPGSETGRQAIQAPFGANLSFREMMGALQQQKEMFKSKVAPLEQEYATVTDAPGVKEYGSGATRGIKEWHVAREGAQRASDTIDRIYKESGGTMGKTEGVATSAPVKVQTPADASKLAPGTHYVTPDGREYTR